MAAKQMDVTLQVEVPANVKRQLLLKAAQEGVTMRTLVLKALREQGIQVADSDILDRRKQR
jgi:predicted HicB family RNase H-like nuclease